MTHMPIALLEDRSGEALDNWLIRNPQIQYITRDRGRMFHRGYKQNNSWCYTNLRPIPSNQEYDGHDDTGNRENNPSDQEKAQIRIS